MNLNKLKGKLREQNKSYQDCANAIGKSVATFNKKINGERKFYIDELEALGNFLEMSGEEKREIFLQ